MQIRSWENLESISHKDSFRRAGLDWVEWKTKCFDSQLRSRIVQSYGPFLLTRLGRAFDLSSGRGARRGQH
jgi:hypothetical protein